MHFWYNSLHPSSYSTIYMIGYKLKKKKKRLILLNSAGIPSSHTTSRLFRTDYRPIRLKQLWGSISLDCYSQNTIRLIAALFYYREDRGAPRLAVYPDHSQDGNAWLFSFLIWLSICLPRYISFLYPLGFLCDQHTSWTTLLSSYFLSFYFTWVQEVRLVFLLTDFSLLYSGKNPRSFRIHSDTVTIIWFHSLKKKVFNESLKIAQHPEQSTGIPRSKK